MQGHAKQKAIVLEVHVIDDDQTRVEQQQQQQLTEHRRFAVLAKPRKVQAKRLGLFLFKNEKAVRR